VRGTIAAPAIVLVAGTVWGVAVYHTGGTHALALLVESAALNVGLLTALLWLWHRLTERRRLVQQLDRELRYFRTWGGEEGVRRKAGLIRDINTLGAVPESLEQAVLSGADLSGADLHGCNLRGADLSGADLQGAFLERADLWGANLSGANLSLANLHGADLRSGDLDEATLVKCNLAEADLHRASLVGANLEGSGLEGARLHRARFARRGADEFQESVHASVEDWIRARLDARGYYTASEE